MTNPVVLATPPDAIRVFAGYRRAGLDLPQFYTELGQTFMPGTPAILAPLGLGAYVAAVLDLGDTLPDEVALIVYASVAAYNQARQGSLIGRMYTHSHAGVFDMARSRGQFPGPRNKPVSLTGEDRLAWYLSPDAVDWQQGDTRLLFVTAPDGTNVQHAVLAKTNERATALAALGVAQLVVVATPAYAAIWLNGTGIAAVDAARLDIVPASTVVRRDLIAQPVAMPNLVEGPAVASGSAYTFRFVRDLRHFLA